MATKIFQEGHNTIFDNGSTYKPFPSHKCRYTVVSGLFKFYDQDEPKTLYNKITSGAYTDFQNQNGDSFASETAFKSYLNTALGGGTSTGSGSGSDVKTPVTAFGELMTESMTPVIQMSALYGLLPKGRTVEIGSGTAGANENLFFASTGAATNSSSAVFSERQLHYKPGQGALARGTAMFDTPANGNIQRWGLQTAADGYVFGYNSSSVFGISRIYGGHVAIQKLTITTPASGSENATITIDGTGYTVPLTAGTAVHNTNEIANSLNSQIPLWRFSQNNGFVICRSLLDDPITGAFTLSSSTAVGTFSEIADSNEVSVDFIPQTSWNVDKMDGTGVSGMTLDQQKGNVYQIAFQYLGFGNIHFFIENSENGDFQEVHQIKYTNNNIIPSVGNPTFRITWSSINSTNSTDITVNGASCAAFVQGNIVHTETGRARENSKSVGISSFLNILTIRNRTVFGTNVNLSEVIPQLVTAYADTVKGAIIEICKGTFDSPITLGGTPDFQYEDENNSVVEYDVDGTSVTGGKLVHSFIAGQAGEVDLTKFDELLLSGETLTIAARAISGSSADVTVTLNWDEEL